MPEPLLYFKAMVASAVACVIVVGLLGQARSDAWRNVACGLGMGLGLALGYYVLGVRPAWPPANGLDRLLTIVGPLALGIEILAGWPRSPRWLVGGLRLSLCGASGIILLYGSVYLSGVRREWSTGQAIVTLAAWGVLLAVLWTLLLRLWRRSPGVSLPIALALSIQCAGVAIMLAGYLQGGAAAFPWVAVLIVTALALRMFSEHSHTPMLVGLGLVGLFGLVFIGRYFGNLTTAAALTLLLAPLGGWAVEAPRLRRQKSWFVGTLRVFLVAIPLIIVLVLAKKEFDRKLAPLLMKAPGPSMSRSAV